MVNYYFIFCFIFVQSRKFNVFVGRAFSEAVVPPISTPFPSFAPYVALSLP